LEIDPGPHLARFPPEALGALVSGAFRVSRVGDRVGVRLEGDRVPRDRADSGLPVPMRRGAVQVSTDGTPIVLGPDHPVTGGYPVIAVVRRPSQAALARLRPGRAVRFVMAGV
jgi:allophanate hydrolase subunit 2